MTANGTGMSGSLANARAGKARILAIDDSKTIIAHLKGVLEPRGYRVDTLDMFIELPTLIKNDPPDLVILDLNMPTIPGIPLGGLIRKFQPHEIPIVVYSSQPRAELEEAAHALRAAAVVAKGETDDNLIKTVEAVLAIRRSGQQRS